MYVDLELYREDVQLDGVRLSAIDVTPDFPERTLVFLHGFGGYAMQWQHQLRAFSDSNRCIALDLRGHGRSDKPESNYTLDELLGDLRATLQRLRVRGPIVLFGHSFGGALAAEYAVRYPNDVAQLIIVATAVRYRIAPLYHMLLHLPIPALNIAERFVRSWLSAPPRALKPFYFNTLSRWEGSTVLPRITVPTLVVIGARDMVMEKAAFAAVPTLIPGAETVDVGASGHMVMIERRDAFNRAATRFLRPIESLGWRGSPAEGANPLLRERPWLRHYDEGVPLTIGIPRRSLDRLLASAARRFSLRPALLFYGRALSYGALNRRVDRLANALRALGVDRGARVLLLMPNVPQAVIAYYAILRAGGVAVFVLPTSGEDEVVRYVQDSGAKILITLTRSGQLARAVKRRTSLQHVIFTHFKEYLPWYAQMLFSWQDPQAEAHTLPFELEPGMHDMRTLMSPYPAQAPEVQLDPDDLAVIQYTGGTTALPKGVMLTHRNLVANTLQTRHWLPAAVEGRAVFLSVLPFSHIYGTTAALNVPIAIGAALVLLPRFEVREVLEAIKRHRPSYFPGVPQMYLALKDYPDVRRYRIDSIHWCISGAAPLPVEVQEAFERLTHGRLVEGYGLTEAAPITHANPLKSDRTGSIGVPLPSTEARIVDLARVHGTAGRIMPPGQIGELIVRGPQVMRGYWNDPSATARTIRDGWLYTGDIARMDEDGYFTIVARKQDLWYPERAQPGAAPVFPRDIEEVLYEVPQVKEVVVIGVAGHPIAFVISHSTQARPEAETLIAYCRRRLPPELVPQLVIFVDDFPRTFIGKVLRRELAKRVDLGRLHEAEQSK